MQYRKDIDGLRALAVGGVLLSHVQTNPIVVGGFFGVDIFFVISGYLISGILFAHYDATQQFSYADFYLRRAKRILPALFVVIACTSIAGYILLPTYNYGQLVASAWSSLGSVANIYFYFTTEYWQKNLYICPLIHMWSLGIEEQFYIIFPFFITFLLIKKRMGYRDFFFVLSLVCLASFFLSIYMQKAFNSFTFYMLPTRLWELGGGVLLACYERVSPKRFPLYVAQVLSLGALAMLLYAMFSVHRYTPFWAAVVVLASGVLLASPNTMTARVFSLRPCVLVGKISYSLYLWHWPIWTFWTYSKASISVWDNLGVLALSGVLAFLSWYSVENPFRKLSSWRVFLWRVSPLVLLCLVSISLTVALPRVPVRQLTPWLLPAAFQNASTLQDITAKNITFLGKGDVAHTNIRPTFALIGDSHAQCYAPLFDQVAQEYALFGAFFAAHTTLIYAQDQGPMAQAVVDYLTQEPSVTTIVIAQKWDYYTDAHASMEEGLHRLLAAGKTVYLIEQAPRHAKRSILWAAYSKTDAAPASLEGSRIVRKLITSIRHKNLHRIESVPYFQEGKAYAFVAGANMLYMDANHLSMAGAQRLRPAVEAFFQSMQQR